MKKFQRNVRQWCESVFGTTIANDKNIRNYRFIEEAIELVQSLGMTKEEVLAQVDFVYNRDIGEAYQEVGGLMITLAQLCNVNNLEIKLCAHLEYTRINDNNIIQNIKAKEYTKLGQTYYARAVNHLSDNSIKLMYDDNSSTGEVVQSNRLLYLYINKCKLPYGSGLAVAIAENKEEAHILLLRETEEYIFNRYDINNWEKSVALGHATISMFISENSYEE